MFEIRKDGFYLNGKKFRLLSGAMHYFRVLPELWEDRLIKMKAAGFNGVETVMCWNLHEPEEGKFDFSGMLDIVKFCNLAAKHGLYVIVRPGPYTCGEWDFGGFPAWLLKDKNLRIRCNNPNFIAKVANYYKAALPRLEPLQIHKGGNIISMQVENEYGSYGNDKDYLTAIKKLIVENGITLPLFTSDGTCHDMLSGGTLPGIYITQNFGSRSESAFNNARQLQPNLPDTCMEFWCGWFDHWGEIHHKRNPHQVAREIRNLLANNANLNIYMFHGGTNFNFWAGANYAHKYMPTVTSYDDAALLNEYGDYTPAYHEVRKILYAEQGLDISAPLPASPQLQHVGKVDLKATDLWSNLYNLGTKHESATPESMETYGQNFGLILYRKEIKGKYGAHKLIIEGVHDIAYVRVNGKQVASYYRHKNPRKKYNDGFCCRVPAFDGSMVIEILVEAMGRINYGAEMETDRKGIQKVRLDYQAMFGWEIYTLPFDNISKVDYTKPSIFGAPSILKGRFSAAIGKDCFLDMKGFDKGFVFINGYHIGRYWKAGPQRTLYIPAPLLKLDNEIVVVEQEKYRKAAVEIVDKHML